jgi:ubiquinone/menaquinone biosynthesis C-methylase UbiE
MNTNQTSYNDIAEWYDRYLSEHPIYLKMLLPHLLALVGEVEGERVCDLACGQGWFARELARRGARVTGIDVAERLLEIARRYEQEEPLGLDYRHEDAGQAASLASGSFDGVVCVLALMDMPQIDPVCRTMRRLLKPNGWLVVALTHPCFELPQARWMTTEEGQVLRAVRGYFQEGYWQSESGGIRSRVGAYHRTLSTYLNALIANGLALERLVEPMATGEYAERVPGLREVPALLLVRARAI